MLSWYTRNRRRLPWRERPTPYRVWVSEIMLQQTTVKTVLPYYERFLKRFPNTASLASAKEAEVLRLWAGLGYYSRARNLRRAAQAIVRDHGGRFPDVLEAVLELPGIGRYTAGAILSIAFGKPYPLLDGNVARVFSRLFAVQGDIKKGPLQDKLWALADELLDRRRPGDWNQALMELGALVCVPAAPRCGECPLSAGCAAFKRGLQDRLPETGPQRRPVTLRWSALWIERTGAVLLHRRPETERFLPGHWGLPEGRHLDGTGAGTRVATVRHSITYHRISMEVRRAAAPQGRLPAGMRWVPRRGLERYLVSSLWRKAAAAVKDSA